MTTFLWVLFWLFVLENIGRIIMLATGRFPQRTATVTALDLVLTTALLGWVVVLLVKGA